MDGDSGSLARPLPFPALRPLAPKFSPRDQVPGDDEADRGSAVRQAVGRVEMTVRAEVAAVDLPIEEVLALGPGDVVRLDGRAADGVTLYAGSVAVHRAKPGRSGG